jgi:hypothetical protein
MASSDPNAIIDLPEPPLGAVSAAPASGREKPIPDRKRTDPDYVRPSYWAKVVNLLDRLPVIEENSDEPDPEPLI